MKIDCLMGTYGRFSPACESLACFLRQSAIENATLLIYNQHPIPLKFDHPKVRVVNEPGRRGSLRHIRQRMLDLADRSASFIHWWEDDDLYLPWHLEDCLRQIGSHVAWKPFRSWYSWSKSNYDLVCAPFEGSWVFRADYLAKSPLSTHPTYIDHPAFTQVNQSGLLALTDLRASYIYRWYDDWSHVAAFGGSNLPELQEGTMAVLAQKNDDAPPDGLLIPAELTSAWDDFLAGARPKMAAADWDITCRNLRCGSV
jgi:hypothetical protein